MVNAALLRPLILLHRWFGVAFCLLFAMWFASGIVMHFVPFPAPHDSDRLAALLPLDLTRVSHSPAQAVTASEIAEALRVRLIARADGPVYIVAGSQQIKALGAADLGDTSVRSAEAAIVLATEASDPAKLNRPDAVQIASDQWSVGQQYDRHRPLYRVALNDAAGTERYVSATTGEIVLVTTRDQRRWNYVGSIAHWIYPMVLRGHPHLWSALLWWLALLAALGASLGAVVGILRVGFKASRPQSPYFGWHAIHHWLGLVCMPFVLSWIVSGWLSMDRGGLFSTGEVVAAERRAIIGSAEWQHLPADELQRLSGADTEVEWFVFGGRIYRRERLGAQHQQLAVAGVAQASLPARAFVSPDEVDSALEHVGRHCERSFPIPPQDAYTTASSMANAPILRVVCGDDWFHIDGANGALIERLDSSRRAYRWLYNGPHTLNFPIAMRHPTLRTALIVLLCSCGFVFSLTAIVIAQSRLRSLR